MTLGPVLLGLILASAGALGSAAPKWARVAFLAVQFFLIYVSGYATLVGLAFSGLLILLFGLFLMRKSPVSASGLAIVFAVYMAFWLVEKYAMPLVFTPDFTLHHGWARPLRQGAQLISIAGLSYIGFKLIHLYVDARRGDVENADPVEILSWLFLFPSILAGPMQRFQDWQEQRAEHANITAEDAVIGLRRIFLGVFMKFGLADNIHGLTLPMAPTGALAAAPLGAIVLGAYIYSIYLFLDFAGYCHIAIGGARFLGVRLPENFNKPYLARNLADFWNRWHITLSEILRDYLFYPLSLATKRLPLLRRLPDVSAALPPLVTFIIAGVWHGAGWPFVVYGLIHGVGLAFLAVKRRRQIVTPFGKWWKKSIAGHVVDTAINLSYVTFSFVFFSLPPASLMLLGHRLLHSPTL